MESQVKYTSKPKLYLAGAIDHVTPEQATGWRRMAREKLEEYYEILDPTEGKDLPHPEANTALYTPKQIVETDLAAIEGSHALLVEAQHSNIPYWGTAMEVRQAWCWKKLIVAWGVCKSYWLRYHADVITGSLDDAIAVLKAAAKLRRGY